MKNRVELYNKIKREIKTQCTNSKSVQKIAKKTGMPFDMAIDFLNMHNYVEDATDKQLFSLTKALIPDYEWTYYFSESEIKEYNKVYEESKSLLPIKWNLIQVADDQWIGKISVLELMKLRNAQMINYNPETQRPAKFIDNIAHIDINRRAVHEIEELFLNGSYVPNVLTLNMPIDAEYEYEEGILIVKSINMFDILDGYHRYIAISDLYNKDPNFSYDMEFRLVAFSESKARQFIFQEDQKNKIKKIASEGYNQNSYAVQVVKLLNEEPLLHGMFNANGQISNALAARMINLFAFENRKKYSRKEVLEAEKFLVPKFDKLLKSNSYLLDKKWNNKFTILIFYLFYTESSSKLNYVKETENLLKNKNISSILVDSFDRHRLNKLNKLIKGV